MYSYIVDINVFHNSSCNITNFSTCEDIHNLTWMNDSQVLACIHWYYILSICRMLWFSMFVMYSLFNVLNYEFFLLENYHFHVRLFKSNQIIIFIFRWGKKWSRASSFIASIHPSHHVVCVNFIWDILHLINLLTKNIMYNFHRVKQ